MSSEQELFEAATSEDAISGMEAVGLLADVASEFRADLATAVAENKALRTDLERTAQERDAAQATAEARRKLIKAAELAREDMRTQWMTMQGALSTSDKNWQAEIERRKVAEAELDARQGCEDCDSDFGPCDPHARDADDRADDAAEAELARQQADAEIMRLNATVARVQAVLGEWDGLDAAPGFMDDIRAALDGDPA